MVFGDKKNDLIDFKFSIGGCAGQLFFTNIVCTPSKCSKREGLTGSQFLEGGCWERGGVFFLRGRGGGGAIFT